MMYLLPALSSGIGNDTKAALGVRLATLLERELGGQYQHAPQQGLMLWPDLRHRRNVLLWDEQKMHRCPGVDVVESEDVSVFVDLAAGNRAASDFAENTVFRMAHEAQGKGWLVAGRRLAKRIQPRIQRYKYQSQTMP